MRMVLKGNTAVAQAVRMAQTQFISAYPITPRPRLWKNSPTWLQAES